MKFTNDADVNRTSYKGSVTASYDELVLAFGLPDHGPDDLSLDKVTCEWDLCFEDGTVATIYDWKMDSTPFGKYEWHIGGRTSDSVDRVLEVFYEVEDNQLTEYVAEFYKTLDKKLGCAPSVSAELMAQFNAKLNKGA